MAIVICQNCGRYNVQQTLEEKGGACELCGQVILPPSSTPADCARRAGPDSAAHPPTVLPLGDETLPKCPHCNRFDEGLVTRGYCRHCRQDVATAKPSEREEREAKVGNLETQALFVSNTFQIPDAAIHVGTNVIYCSSCRTVSTAPGTMTEKCSRCGQQISNLGPLKEVLVPNRTAAVLALTLAIAWLAGSIVGLFVNLIMLAFVVIGLILLVGAYGKSRTRILVCEYGIASIFFWNSIGFCWSDICNVLEEYEEYGPYGQGGFVSCYTVTLKHGEFKFHPNFPRDGKRLAELIFSKMRANQANWIKKVTKKGVLVVLL